MDGQQDLIGDALGKLCSESPRNDRVQIAFCEAAQGLTLLRQRGKPSERQGVVDERLPDHRHHHGIERLADGVRERAVAVSVNGRH